MTEAIYDEQIAPLLRQAGKLCEQHGLAMVAVVEYDKEARGETRLLPDGAGLAMHMLSMLADRAYQAHHFSCPQCIAAGVTRSQPRCEAGDVLWSAYQHERDPRRRPAGRVFSVRKP
ncbi:hypothetical protein [Delftia acidovorans]|uniref:hypothetical protein n=1 Tax=Delftia acidovorans TaxID=80866 RepID=UPI000BD1FAF6|nr:hypothetical protein [Delftia acidovorans]SOE35247.1 hypothetical protein SAMN05216519_1227 [Delftia acidovorans]